MRARSQAVFLVLLFFFLGVGHRILGQSRGMSQPSSRASEKQPEFFLSSDGNTIKNRAGEVVARRIEAYEAVVSSVKALSTCPPGKSWKCVRTERRYKLVCVKYDPKIGCLKEKVVSWLECVAYDCR